jgi:hypothetical protein
MDMEPVIDLTQWHLVKEELDALPFLENIMELLRRIEGADDKEFVQYAVAGEILIRAAAHQLLDLMEQRAIVKEVISRRVEGRTSAKQEDREAESTA